MPEFICETCATQYSTSTHPPEHCVICEDARQFVGFNGQRWTTLDELRRKHRNEVREEEPELAGIRTMPAFGVDQRAHLIECPSGNVLWDCIALLDDQTAAFIHHRGGLEAIAISHPHYYTTMIEWSRAFGNTPIYLHADDREWVARNDPAIRFWTGDQMRLHDDLTLIRGGGHFPGATMLHWPAGASGRGALLSGDTIQVVPDCRWVSFMYSYVNYIPLHPEAVRRVVRSVEKFKFDRIYGAFHPRTVHQDAKAVIERSVNRYFSALGIEP